MNHVNLYQNYMPAYQNTNTTRNAAKPTAYKHPEKSSKNAFANYGSEAVFERTATEDDIRKMQQAREHKPWDKRDIKDSEKDSLEKFKIKKKNQDIQLSDKAQAVLDQLKEKYGNMDFFVASTNNEEETRYYLSQGTKDYSVVIDPETLEEMASDEESFKKYDSILSNAGGTFEEVKKELGEDANVVANLGMSIDKNGNVTLFAELDKHSMRMLESQKKQREAHAAEKKEATKKAEKDAAEEKAEQKRTNVKNASNAPIGNRPPMPPFADKKMTIRVTGSNVEDLINSIREAIQAETYQTPKQNTSSIVIH